MDKPEMQRIFDKTYRYIVIQGPCISKLSCRYRSENDDKACALGMHLSDDEYKKEMETQTLKLNITMLPERFKNDFEFYYRLQNAHDHTARVYSGASLYSKEEWHSLYTKGMLEVAKNFKLKTDNLDLWAL